MIKQFIAFSAVITMLAFTAYAQKLSNTQKQSIHAPAKVKIDGRADEWGDHLQAYNHAIQVDYTVANDDKKLYLIIKTDKREIINKIVNGGISFTVKKNGKKEIGDGPTITYPVFNWRSHPFIRFAEMNGIRPHETDAQKKMDSLVTISNDDLEAKAKYIRVIGLPQIDTLISVYNTDGIKTHSTIDNKMNLVMEMSVELKLLGLSTADLSSFSYNIKLNGTQIDYLPGVKFRRDDNGKVIEMNFTNSRLTNVYITGLHDTDCWGTYTLVK